MNNRFLKNLFRSFSESVGGLLDRLGPAKTEKKDILQLTEDAVLSFLALLDRQFGPDQARLERALRNLQEKPTAKAAREMYEAAEPRRLELFRRINLAPGGTKPGVSGFTAA
jgi:hypothetical protein